MTQQTICYDLTMKAQSRIVLLLLRLSLAWIFLYSSISKIFDDTWSSQTFLSGVQTFPGFFSWFASPGNIGWVDFLNVYGQLALGIALLLGVFLPLAAVGGSLLMLLYYLTQLHFPYAGRGTTSLLIDQHIIYALCLFILWKYDAGKYLGLKDTLRPITPSPLKGLL